MRQKIEDNQSEACICRNAVERSYGELINLGQSNASAFNVATRVYSFYHPDVPKEAARRTIAEWLDHAN